MEKHQDIKQDLQFINQIIDIGKVYAEISPKVSKKEIPLNFFLDTLWLKKDDTEIQKGTKEIEVFFEGVKDLELAIKNAITILKSIQAVNDKDEVELQEFKQSPELLKEAVEAGRTNTAYTSITIGYGGGSGTGINNPWAIIGSNKFIDYVEEVEAGYPQDTPQEILTRIRNLYYSSSDLAFSQLLPNAPDTEVLYSEGGDGRVVTSFIERIVRPGSISREAFNRLSAQANENAIGDNPSPYILRRGQGFDERIDVGHALLTLDALLHPGSGQPYIAYNIPTIDPASWVADVAIGVAWVEAEQNGSPHRTAPPNLRLSSSPTSTEIDLYYSASAPLPDLLGDIDGFGLFYEWQSKPNSSLSEVLQSYYGGSNPGVNNRWLTFCRLNRFVTMVDNTVIWQVEDIGSELVQRVNNMAALVLDDRRGAAYTLATGERASPYQEFPYTNYMLNKFLDFVYQNLQRELGS